MIRITRAEILATQDALTLDIPVKGTSLEILNCASDSLQILLRVQHDGQGIYLKGSVELDITEMCDLCLSEYNTTLHGKFEILYTNKRSLVQNSDEQEIYLFTLDQPEINIDPIVNEALLLEEPMKHLCKDDCKGLCPYCGTNLNESTCACKEDTIDDRWKPLKHLTHH
ncbi:MAG: DUF177 domain-containing protein [Candidatus Marinimicrobia bacterium]|nr:DUF177 domain-containing protein [Candidatus Neomarinimicrobiota bacterium]MBL7046913.1 DUF177 domain-containing protein [Candidatus Neomarinimicrobiota bacterium]